MLIKFPTFHVSECAPGVLLAMKFYSTAKKPKSYKVAHRTILVHPLELVMALVYLATIVGDLLLLYYCRY